jgi:hypothetical protein
VRRQRCRLDRGCQAGGRQGERGGATRKRQGGGRRSRGRKPSVREASHKEANHGEEKSDGHTLTLSPEEGVHSKV